MRDGKPVLRPKLSKTVCEMHAIREAMRPGDSAAEGCAKGHWRDKPDLTDGEEMILDLYAVAKATGGSMLTEAERNSEWLLKMFGLLAEADRLLAVREQTEQRTLIIGAIQRGRK